LVVVAIIALLISILVPSLSAAREKARRTVCMAHMNAIGKARVYYAMDYNEWLAGPATTGYELTHGDAMSEIEEEDISSPTAPVQNMDWVSPTLGGTMKFPARDIKRLVQIFNTKLRCPSNKEYYDEDADGETEAAGVRVDQIRYSSYVATEGFHLLGADKAVDGRSVTAIKADLHMVDFPLRYEPREGKVGPPASKIYALEGARSVKDGLVTFNDWHYQDEGGNFMVFGPAVGKSRDPTLLSGGATATALNDVNRRYAWRHDDGMNMAYFDGHGEHVKWKRSLSVCYYFPSGTVIKAAYLGQDPDDYNGMEIP
jgi:prepilin-type processing-associated H-X9-DG protein